MLQKRRIPVQIEKVQEELETAVECYRVFANWGAFPQTPLGGRAAPRIPPAKTPATGVPSNRPARCNPSAALTVPKAMQTLVLINACQAAAILGDISFGKTAQLVIPKFGAHAITAGAWGKDTFG